MFIQESKIISAIRSLKNSRYPNLLINQSINQALSDDSAKSVASGADLHFINYRDDVLPADSSVILGAYTRSEFQDWLNTAARTHSGILLWNADVLISTWDESVRKAFFKEFFLNGINYGPSTVLVSWLGNGLELEEIHNREIKILNMDKIEFLEG